VCNVVDYFSVITRSIPHLNKFVLVVHKKNQGLMQKTNTKRNMIIKPSQKNSRILGIRGCLEKDMSKNNASTVENMVTTRTTILS
jgi:hypothetical protein